MRQAVVAIARFTVIGFAGNCLRKIVAYFASASGQLSGRSEWHALKSRLYFNAGQIWRFAFAQDGLEAATTSHIDF